LWATSRTAPQASFVPLATLCVLSIAGALLVRWGPLARDSLRPAIALASCAANEEPIARCSRPHVRFADLHGHHQLKARLLEAGRAVAQQRRRGGNESARNGILLHGQPGNGKTAFVEALAGELRLPLLTLTYSDVASKWVGEKTALVRAAFEQAMLQQPCVLLLDEVDSLLESREHAHAGSIREDRDLVNALLTLIEQVRAQRVLLVAATNHRDRLDPAAVREGRFDFKIEVPPPDRDARLGLLEQGLGRMVPRMRIQDGLLESLAARWNGYSAKRILAIVAELPGVLQKAGRETPDFRDFMDALRAVQGRSQAGMENVKPLHELVLSERTRFSLENVIARMQDPERTESLGGTLPTGLVFHGPPGTGKTATAKSLAHALAWTFLARTGGELARDPAALDRLYADALELRPTIVFIDEADDLVRHRGMSISTEATNKLLTLVDGVADRVPDVVWIAATNHLEEIDPALLRGGRFSEKIVFELPSDDALVAHIASWLSGRRMHLEPGFDVRGLVEWLGPSSIATAEAVVQMALNLAIARGNVPLHVTRGDVLHALDIVMG
jgi:transitional endoplasmic reticulum ATPase